MLFSVSFIFYCFEKVEYPPKASGIPGERRQKHSIKTKLQPHVLVLSRAQRLFPLCLVLREAYALLAFLKSGSLRLFLGSFSKTSFPTLHLSICTTLWISPEGTSLYFSRCLAITRELWSMELSMWSQLSLNSKLHCSLPAGVTGLKVSSTFSSRQADVTSITSSPTFGMSDLTQDLSLNFLIYKMGIKWSYLLALLWRLLLSLLLLSTTLGI